MLGEFWYNGSEFWYNGMEVCNMLVDFWYNGMVGLYHVRGCFGTMVWRFVP